MLDQSFRSLRRALGLGCVLVLTACSASTVVEHINPYRIDVRQGNYVDQDMVAQLQKGMTRDQVQFLLGRALITDSFHENRWDYIYFFRSGRSGDDKRRLLSVFFDDQGLLERVDDDPAAAEGKEPVAPVNRNRVVDITAEKPKAK